MMWPEFEDSIELISSNSDSDSDPEPTPEPEPETDHETPPAEGSLNRRNLRWLHAGLYKNAQGDTKDIWFAFKKTFIARKKGYRIIYASDGLGSSLGNKNVGRVKRDMITWDAHHLTKWEEYLNKSRNWIYKNAMAGRRVQRATLLATWLDLHSPDIHAHGKVRNRVLDPPQNVIHTVNDKSGPAPRIPGREKAPEELDPEDCYPDTVIPYSTIKIKVDCYKEINADPQKVVANFISSNLATNPRFTARRNAQNDGIESAFYDLGWRINRQALEKANDGMAVGNYDNAYHCKAWRMAPPLWVDKYKGDDLDALLRQMKGEARQDENESESESDDVSIMRNDDTDLDMNSSDGDDEDASLFLPLRKKSSARAIAKAHSKRARTRAAKRKSKGVAENSSKSSYKVRRVSSIERAMLQRMTGLGDDDTEEEYDFLPESSMAKGKSVAQKRKRTVEPEAVIKSSDDESDSPNIFDKQPVMDPSEPSDADSGVIASIFDKPVVIDLSDEQSPNVFDNEEEMPSAKRPKRQEPLVINLDSDFDDNSDMEIIEELSCPACPHIPKAEDDLDVTDNPDNLAGLT